MTNKTPGSIIQSQVRLMAKMVAANPFMKLAQKSQKELMKRALLSVATASVFMSSMMGSAQAMFEPDSDARPVAGPASASTQGASSSRVDPAMLASSKAGPTSAAWQQNLFYGEDRVVIPDKVEGVDDSDWPDASDDEDTSRTSQWWDEDSDEEKSLKRPSVFQDTSFDDDVDRVIAKAKTNALLLKNQGIREAFINLLDDIEALAKNSDIGFHFALANDQNDTLWNSLVFAIHFKFLGKLDDKDAMITFAEHFVNMGVNDATKLFSMARLKQVLKTDYSSDLGLVSFADQFKNNAALKAGLAQYATIRDFLNDCYEKGYLQRKHETLMQSELDAWDVDFGLFVENFSKTIGKIIALEKQGTELPDQLTNFILHELRKLSNRFDRLDNDDDDDEKRDVALKSFFDYLKHTTFSRQLDGRINQFVGHAPASAVLKGYTLKYALDADREDRYGAGESSTLATASSDARKKAHQQRHGGKDAHINFGAQTKGKPYQDHEGVAKTVKIIPASGKGNRHPLLKSSDRFGVPDDRLAALDLEGHTSKPKKIHGDDASRPKSVNLSAGKVSLQDLSDIDGMTAEQLHTVFGQIAYSQKTQHRNLITEKLIISRLTSKTAHEIANGKSTSSLRFIPLKELLFHVKRRASLELSTTDLDDINHELRQFVIAVQFSSLSDQDKADFWQEILKDNQDYGDLMLVYNDYVALG